jgi:cysteine desulfurase/selenocysteine lyase
MLLLVFDIARARAETPGCMDRVHLNNAGAGLMTEGVVAAQIDHLRLEARIGGYEAAAVAQDAFEGVYGSIARLIGAERDEIAVVENATAGWNSAFHSIAFEPGDVVLTAEVEYAANYIAYLQAVRDLGIELRVVPSDATGQLDVEALRAMIDNRTKLISVTHIPTNGGLVNPAEEIGSVAKSAGVPYLLDACQSVGHIEVDVNRIQCDFLTAAGRKYLRGPRGTGFLYVRRSMLETVTPPFVDLHGATWVDRDHYELRPDARRYEYWEFNHAAVLGLGVAVDEALAWGFPAIEERIVALADTLRSRLANVGLPIYDLGERRCGIVTTQVPGVDTTELRDHLVSLGINTSVSRPASTLIDAERRNLPDLLRLSPHYFNNDDDLDTAVSALADSLP